MTRHGSRALALLLALASATALAADDVLRKPREVSWKQFRADVFQDAWRMSDERTENASEPDLRRDLISLVARRFATRDAPAWTYGLGDIVAEFADLRDDDEGTRRKLEELERANPTAWRAVQSVLPQLVREDRVSTGDWEPSEDDDRDGILVVEPFDKDVMGGAWAKLSGNDDVHQAACLMWADLEAVKAAENDYAAYPDNVAADYEEIHAVAGSYATAVDDEERTHKAVQLYFEQDLPFPYSTYECVLNVDTYPDAEGRLVTDIYTESEDFHWLAGQDVAIPLLTSDERFVALLHVRVYGFDIDDVPDGTGNRLEALRGSLGNLKRNAESRYRDYGGEPRTVRGAVPEFVVTGAAKR